MISPRALGPIATLLLLACSRTPAEPAPSASSEPRTQALATPTAKERGPACVVPLASAAPALPPPAGAACPVDPELGGPKLPVVTVRFPETPGGAAAASVRAELAKTPASIERGLMFRRAMDEDAGMLFKLSERRVHTFWMHNTCIPLDMLFIDDDGAIVGVVESAPTLDDDTRSVRCPSSWVLEVNAGWVRRHGVQPGQRITIPDDAR